MDKFKDMEDQFEQKVVETEIEKLRVENIALKKTLEEYGIIEIEHISDIEVICLNGIKKIKELSKDLPISQDDAKILDILHKNLRTARGKISVKEAPGKMLTEDELLKLVK